MAKYSNPPSRPSAPPAKQPLEGLVSQVEARLKPSAIDPIEAAKAGGELEPGKPAAEPPEQRAQQQAVPEPTLPELTVPRTADVYEVERDIVISWGAQTLYLRAGDKLSEDSYGDGAIERFRERGVALKKA